jgi:hypothetical protein
MEKLELHYYLEGGVHSMDAFVKNRSEAELLKILKEVSETLNIKVKFESEALKEGGVLDYIKVLTSPEVLPFLTFFGGIFSNVLTKTISDYLNTDQEKVKIDKEEAKLRIRKLQKELGETEDEEQQKVIVQSMIFGFLDLDKIKMFKSKFYSALLEESKVTRISSNQLDENNQQLAEDKIVTRPEFKKFIIDKIPLESEEIVEAYVEIVAPVLSMKKIKWRGIYDEKPISFKMLDKVFQEDVFKRVHSFSNGDAIKCTLEFEKEVDDEGNEKVTNINAYDVTEVVVGGSISETRTGRRNRLGGNQTSMGFEEDI